MGWVVIDLDQAEREMRIQREVEAAADSCGEGVCAIAGAGDAAAGMDGSQKQLGERLRGMRAAGPRLREPVTRSGQVGSEREGFLCGEQSGGVLGADFGDCGDAPMRFPGAGNAAAVQSKTSALSGGGVGAHPVIGQGCVAAGGRLERARPVLPRAAGN